MVTKKCCLRGKEGMHPFQKRQKAAIKCSLAYQSHPYDFIKAYLFKETV